MKKVSVIVPAYNVEKYIGKCLFSLVNQTLEDIEIIIINDGSSDGTLNIIEEYHKKYPEKIIYKTIENGGAANARNVALSMAQGEYIGFVDSDDDVDFTMFEKMYRKGKGNDSDIVTCGYNRICLQDIQKRDYFEWPCFGKSVHQAPSLYTRNVPYIWNKIFKKSLIESEGAFFEPSFRIYEDLIFTYKLFLRANRIERVTETLYNYVFLREGSLTYSFTEKRFDIFKAFDLLLDYFEKNKAMMTFEEEILFVLLNHIYVVCGGNVKFTALLQKYKFIDQAFRYLDEKFPFWKTTDMYFSRYEKNKFLYTKKLYWKLYTLLPGTVRRKLEKKVPVYNRAGAMFEKEYRTQKVNEKRILLSSQHGNNMNGNMFYILKALCTNKMYDEYEIGIVYQKDKKADIEKLLRAYDLMKKNVKLLKVNSKSYTNFLTTAKYLFNDTSFPVYFVKRKEQVYLNTWHGTPLKTLGRSTAEDFYDIANLQKNFLLSDYLLYPSEYMKKHMLEDYMLEPLFENKILMAGYPRNEIFFDTDRREQVRKENEMDKKQCIAYMPTWRGNVRNVTLSQENEVITYLKEIDQRLNDDQVFYVNLHPYLAAQIDYGMFSNIKAFPKEYETYDFLNACDVLVTDYSSVFFDYAVTKRKIILFAYDEEDYFRQRGVYLKFNELSFEKVKTVSDLMKAIDNNKVIDLTEYLEKYSAYEAKDISEKLCNLIINGKDSDLKIESVEASEKQNVMIHFSSLRESSSVEKFIELISNTDFTDRNYYYTYDSKNLMGREKIMKIFPKDLLFFGKFGPYSMVSPSQHSLLERIEENSLAYKSHDKDVKEIFDNEKQRAFAGVRYDCNIIFGKESVKEIGYVSNCEGIKVLYLLSEDDINKKVPEQVYKAYDYIYAETEKIRDEMKKMYPNLNVCLKKATRLQELIE